MTKKLSIKLMMRKAGKLLTASTFLLTTVSIIAQGGPPPPSNPPCGINPLVFTQQAGFGNNNKMIIGGYGQNDGAICWNCYSDSTVYGRNRSYNMPSGIINGGAPIPHWSSRIFQDITSGALRIQCGTATCYDSIQWRTGLSILKTGGVGIGTDNSFNALLAVNGKIYSSDDVEINPSLGWPDYVFTPAYKLPSIRDFERQVKALGYIPQIGSAQQLQDDGHRLGEMQVKQMEVMEIMLLHQFEINRRLEALERENEELKALVKQLLQPMDKPQE